MSWFQKSRARFIPCVDQVHHDHSWSSTTSTSRLVVCYSVRVYVRRIRGSVAETSINVRECMVLKSFRSNIRIRILLASEFVVVVVEGRELGRLRYEVHAWLVRLDSYKPQAAARKGHAVFTIKRCLMAGYAVFLSHVSSHKSWIT
jgi:hypothetical protein